MSFQALMGQSARLLASAQTLAAIVARLRLDELGEDGDPAVRAQLDRVIDVLGVREQLDTLEPQERTIVVAFNRSYLTQALELVDDPARGGAWTYTDPALLQAQGSASAVVARLLKEAGLGSEDARILDVGTGVAGLAIALAAAFPQSTVVGLDPWRPALELARRNVADAGLDARVTLVESPVQEFEDAEGFDLVWLPSFFIPEAAIDAAIERSFGLLRPGGTLVLGAPYGTDDDPLAAAVDDLFTVRSGGSVLGLPDAVSRLRRVGFEDVAEVERTWEAPLRFVVGRRR